MKVIYREDKKLRERLGAKPCPDLIDGKIYEVFEARNLGNGRYCYFVQDEDFEGDYTPYETDIFEVVEE